MTDCELLELAAKAAGLNVWQGRWPQDYMFFAAPKAPDVSGKVTGVEWNPLTDDGDALRLAVKLGQMHGVIISVGSAEARCEVARQTIWSQGVGNNSSIGAETRRAIVQAAASIGKAMP